MYRVIDMEKDPRRAQYEHFSGLQVPFVGVTVKVNVSGLVKLCRKYHFSFYAAMTRVVILAGNRVPEMRRRIVKGEVREYERCSASITELSTSGVYYYCTLHPKDSWKDFFSYAEKTREERKKRLGLFEDDDSNSQFFITSTPALCFEQLILPIDKNVSNPMISWGRYEEDWRGRLMLPLALTTHHALVDGIHISAFYRYVEEELEILSHGEFEKE